MRDEHQTSRFVQITTSVQGGEILLYAIDEAGGVWRFDDKARQWVVSRDDDKETPPAGAESTTGAGLSVREA